SYGDTRIGQGRENAREYLVQHPEVADAIEQRVRELLSLGGIRAATASEDE
ncbi:MAG TPA: DNA recombination/repair protein RecA, partial [Thermaerobacter sp.]